VQRHEAFLRVQQGRPGDALAAAESSLRVFRAHGLDWEAASSSNLAAFASMALGDTARAAAHAAEAVRLRTALGDAWGLVHAEAMLGTIAQADHRLADAATSLARAAATAEQLGFLGQAALHLTTLGRVQQRAGHHGEAAATLERAIAAAVGCGDLRMAATARLNLARVRRATHRDEDAVALLVENETWYHRSGGGDGALLSRLLRAAAEESDAEPIEEALADARRVGDVEAEVLALDALARLAAGGGDDDRARALLRSADDRMTGAAHVLVDGDRVDAHRARILLAGERAPATADF